MARADSGLDGILLIDKPAGWTSHDVVAKARRITGQRRIGHTGTLDPMATGLLVLCLGKATRLVEYMTRHDKKYEGKIILGVATDTDDADGTVISTAPVPDVDEAKLAELIGTFTGTLNQMPPAYSALKVDGQRAYAVARRGGTPDLPKREVRVDRLELTAIGEGRLAISVSCGPGTYIRSLARDIGGALGCGAHLGALRRTQAGGFSVVGATTLDQLTAIVEAGEMEEALLQPDDGILTFDAALVTGEHAEKLSHGLSVQMLGCERAAEVARIYDAGGAFIGVGRVGDDGQIRPIKVFAGA